MIVGIVATTNIIIIKKYLFSAIVKKYSLIEKPDCLWWVIFSFIRYLLYYLFTFIKQEIYLMDQKTLVLKGWTLIPTTEGNITIHKMLLFGHLQEFFERCHAKSQILLLYVDSNRFNLHKLFAKRLFLGR